MYFKKLLSAAIAGCIAASAMIGSAAIQTSAAGPDLTFDIRSGDQNAVTISTKDIAEGDYTVPISIYVPSNPGVNAVNLKLQVNDGEIDENGIFGNYGLYLEEADFASPYCFDSASEGDAAAAWGSYFIENNMNVSWVYSADLSVNADAAAEADTTAWDSSVSWAYDYAFATANLVIPKSTPAGEYTLDIRKESYAVAGSDASGKLQYSQSTCKSADSEAAMSFDSVPLTVTVQDEVSEPWQDDYEIEGAGHYMIIGDVAGAPGETVQVPVYIYNATATAGLQIYFQYDQALTPVEFANDRNNYAYKTSATKNIDSYPMSYTFAGAETMELAHGNGSVLTNICFTIPEDAADGTVYDVNFAHDDPSSILKVVDREGISLDVSYYDGSITVLSTDATALNRTNVSMTSVGQTANLTLFNAFDSVTWSSSDESVATVDQNGFITAVGDGNAVITASNNGADYTCNVKVGGLFGDVDQNGEVSSADSQLTLLHYLEGLAGNSDFLTPEQQLIADVDSNGQVTSADSQYILLYYLEVVITHGDVTWFELTGNPNAPGAP